MRANAATKDSNTGSGVGKVNLLNQLEARSGGSGSQRRSQTSEQIKKAGGMAISKSTNIVKPSSPGMS